MRSLLHLISDRLEFLEVAISLLDAFLAAAAARQLVHCPTSSFQLAAKGLAQQAADTTASFYCPCEACAHDPWREAHREALMVAVRALLLPDVATSPAAVGSVAFFELMAASDKASKLCKMFCEALAALACTGQCQPIPSNSLPSAWGPELVHTFHQDSFSGPMPVQHAASQMLLRQCLRHVVTGYIVQRTPPCACQSALVVSYVASGQPMVGDGNGYECVHGAQASDTHAAPLSACPGHFAPGPGARAEEHPAQPADDQPAAQRFPVFFGAAARERRGPEWPFNPFALPPQEQAANAQQDAAAAAAQPAAQHQADGGGLFGGDMMRANDGLLERVNQQGALHGADNEHGGLFGDLNQRGLFGNDNQRRGLFAAGSQGGLFGGDNQQRVGPFGSGSQLGGHFAAGNQHGSLFAAGSQGGGLFGAGNQQRGLFTNGSGLSSLQPAAAHTTNVPKNAQRAARRNGPVESATAAALFAPASSGRSLFGPASSMRGLLGGRLRPGGGASMGGSLFGMSRPPSAGSFGAPPKSVFGASPTTDKFSGPGQSSEVLFGRSRQLGAASKPATGDVFGSAASAKPMSSSIQFGSQRDPTSTDLFGYERPANNGCVTHGQSSSPFSATDGAELAIFNQMAGSSRQATGKYQKGPISSLPTKPLSLHQQNAQSDGNAAAGCSLFQPGSQRVVSVPELNFGQPSLGNRSSPPQTAATTTGLSGWSGSAGGAAAPANGNAFANGHDHDVEQRHVEQVDHSANAAAHAQHRSEEVHQASLAAQLPPQSDVQDKDHYALLETGVSELEVATKQV